MAIIRTNKRENPFSQIDRYVFEQDDNLSWKAKGLMGYLLTRPDGWHINHKDLVNRAKDGKDAVTSALKELKEAGYIHYYQVREQGGLFGQWMYDVYERPQYNPMFLPYAEDPEAVKQDTDYPEAENSDYNNNKVNNNNLNNNKENFVNNNVNKDKITSDLINEYRLKGLSKELCFRVLDEVKQRENDIENFGGYFRNSLEKVLKRHKIKTGDHPGIWDMSSKENQNLLKILQQKRENY